jgi:acyl-coenzyme A thioesterase PaaI-like protein
MPRFDFRAELIKPGRTLPIAEARGYALRDGGEHLIATMTGTLMAMARREAPSASERVLSPA